MKKIVAIDGPAGSGKGTIASIIADKLNLIYIDTGAMYRALTLKVLRNGIDLSDEEHIVDICDETKIDFDKTRKVYLDGEDVTLQIRSNEVTNSVSYIAKIVPVREKMVIFQRKLAQDNDIIMEGRDITTVVLPNANYKFYLDASIEERAKRRLIQNQEKGIASTYEEIFDNITKRDYNDKNRKVGALKIASDAIYIDTTDKSIDEVVAIMLDKIKE